MKYITPSVLYNVSDLLLKADNAKLAFQETAPSVWMSCWKTIKSIIESILLHFMFFNYYILIVNTACVQQFLFCKYYEESL